MPNEMPHWTKPGLPAPSRPARLRALLHTPDLAFIMEAHSGLSAKIVEEAGFCRHLGIRPGDFGNARPEGQ